MGTRYIFRKRQKQVRFTQDHNRESVPAKKACNLKWTQVLFSSFITVQTFNEESAMATNFSILIKKLVFRTIRQLYMLFYYKQSHLKLLKAICSEAILTQRSWIEL